MKTLAPMLASVGTEVPASGDWIFEPKYDGIRILASATKDGVALITRNGLDKSRQFPEIVEALDALRRRARRPFVLDGEVVAMRADEPGAVSRTAKPHACLQCGGDRDASQQRAGRAVPIRHAARWKEVARRRVIARSASTPLRADVARRRTDALRLSDESSDGAIDARGSATSRLGRNHGEACRRAISPRRADTRLAQAQNRSPARIRRGRVDRAAQLTRAFRRAATRLL